MIIVIGGRCCWGRGVQRLTQRDQLELPLGAVLGKEDGEVERVLVAAHGEAVETGLVEDGERGVDDDRATQTTRDHP